MQKIYIVIGRYSVIHEGSDEWVVAAYTNRIDAETHVRKANQWVLEHAAFDVKDEPNPYNMINDHDYASWDNIDYWMDETNLLEEWKEPLDDYYKYAVYS